MTEVHCWRCGRVIYEVEVRCTLPPGAVLVRKKCPQCKATTITPLDTLPVTASTMALTTA